MSFERILLGILLGLLLGIAVLALAATRAECVYCPSGPCWPEYGCPDVFGECICIVPPGATEGRCYGVGPERRTTP